MDLYFERFINLYRTSPPDFDLDFSWRDRDDVTQYIFKRFPNTALLATYNTFQYKAVVRELGKVLAFETRNRQAQSRRIQWREFGSFGTFSVTLQYVHTGFPVI